jgi:hypothetical protein
MVFKDQYYLALHLPKGILMFITLNRANLAPSQPEGSPTGATSSSSPQAPVSHSRNTENLPAGRSGNPSGTSGPRTSFPYGDDLGKMANWFKDNDPSFAPAAMAATHMVKNLADSKKLVENFVQSGSSAEDKPSGPTTEELEKAMKDAFFKDDSK